MSPAVCSTRINSATLTPILKKLPFFFFFCLSPPSSQLEPVTYEVKVSTSEIPACDFIHSLLHLYWYFLRFRNVQNKKKKPKIFLLISMVL